MAQQYVEIVSQGSASSIGGGPKNFFNVYQFVRLSALGSVSKANIEAAFQTAIITPLLAVLHDSYSQIANTVRFFDDATDAPQSFTETGAGGVSGDRLPDYNAVVVQLRTGLRGKSFRGSKHFGPIPESGTTGDAIASGSVANWTTLYNAIVAGFSDSDGNNWVPVIKSNRPPANYTVNPCIVLAQIVSSARLNLTLGTMRRRKVKTVN